MKIRKFIKTTALTIVLIICASCSNDDTNSNSNKNEVVTHHKTFQIANASLHTKRTDNGVTRFNLYLSSAGVTFDVNENANGTGDILNLAVHSNIEDGLSSGKYVFDDVQFNSFSFSSGYYTLDYTPTQSDSTISLNITSGNLSVLLEDEIYTLTLDAIDEDDNNISVNYKGSIKVFEELP